MSEYLKRKLLSQLREAKEVLSDPCEGVVENVLEEGISHLKSSIRDMDIQVADETPVEKPKAYINYEGADLANIAIDIYKSQQPEKEEVVEVVAPVPTGKKHHYKAIARSLTGMRNGGDVGKVSETTPSGNGNQTNNTNNYHALTTSMTLEEYQEYIKESWGLNETEYVTEEIEEVVLVEEASVTEELKQKLLQLEDTSWQSIDKVMRSLAKDFDITPKELHKKFKTENNGMIPDDWLKEQEVTEECGWFPLSEAMIHKVGSPYEVSLIWRGHTRRLKFFYPELTAPARSDMQRAVNLFYPGGRLLAYYPCEEVTGNPMVLIPPMSENYSVTYEDDWVYMSEQDLETYDLICDTEGDPLESPILVSEGVYEMIVEDFETGEQKVINFGEGYKSDKNYKAPKVPAKKKPYDKIASFSLERPNPIKEDMSGMSQKSGDKRSTESGAGMTAAGVKKYNSRTGGDLKTAVTTPPSKLKAGSKAAGRRKSFCARSKSWNGERGKAARARWNC